MKTFRRIALGQVSTVMGLCAGSVVVAHPGLGIGIFAVALAWVFWREMYLPKDPS